MTEPEANRTGDALERACLTYGPQPFADIANDIALSEAAD
jgi:hypothetical protein